MSLPINEAVINFKLFQTENETTVKLLKWVNSQKLLHSM